uniref:Uncharacterized protein n=1 Tax=Romanomermis culicivorax TaxID=13658 RepID=A0A915L8L9_ROMCU
MEQKCKKDRVSSRKKLKDKKETLRADGQNNDPSALALKNGICTSCSKMPNRIRVWWPQIGLV